MLKEYLRKRICRVAHTDELLQGLAQLKAENETLKKELAASTTLLSGGGGVNPDCIETQLARLQTIQEENSRVERIQLNEIELFFFKNDLITTLQSEEIKKNLGAEMCRQSIMTGRNVIPILLEHYWTHKLNVSFIDVGCQYGHESILTGLYLKKQQKTTPIYCFDIGRTRELMPFNIALNGMEDIISFYPIGISDKCGPIIVYWEPGYSETNRMANPDFGVPRESFSYVMPATTIDAFCMEHQIETNLIAKIDVEGSERRVLHGMRETLKSKMISYIFEYGPHNYSQESGQGLDFLQEVSRTHQLILVGWLEGTGIGSSQQCLQISPEQLPKFAQYVSDHWGVWVDLLALPKNLPGMDEILKKTDLLRLD